jgi:hypothetical protein
MGRENRLNAALLLLETGRMLLMESRIVNNRDPDFWKIVRGQLSVLRCFAPPGLAA